jgi:cytoplasmic FMR1 interacting protein
MKGLPHSTKLPPFEYGAKGCFDYFQLILKPILSYRDLKSGVFQVFREFGNTILFIINLESSVKSTESFQAILNATMVGRYSGYIEPTYEPKLIIKNVMEEANSVITGNTAYCSAKQQGELIDQVFKPSCAPPLFDSTLERLQKYTASMRLQWETTIPSEDDLMVEHSNEFYRLWSAMLFCFSIPTSQTEFSNRELFGEGFLWAGCVLMHLFKEEKRFKAFDFVNFLVFVASNDPKAANEQSGLVELAKFFEISKFNLKISWEIFDTLDYRQKKRNSLLSSQ